jgi:hypothetical protein
MKVLGIASISAAQEKAQTGVQDIEKLKKLAEDASTQTFKIATVVSNNSVSVKAKISEIINRIEKADKELIALYKFNDDIVLNQRRFSNSLALSRSEIDKSKLVLVELQHGIESADRKLSELGTFANSIGMIPDGRLLLGGNLTGRAWILEQGITNLATLYNAQKYSEGYELAKDLIRRHEASEEISSGSIARTGDVYITNDGLSQIYTMGTLCAQSINDPISALCWSRKAGALKPGMQTKRLLLISLKAVDSSLSNIEADMLIRATLNQTNEEAAQFKAFLQKAAIIQ